MKNKTLLLKSFEKGKLGKPSFHAITPLVEIKGYPIDLKKNLAETLNNFKMNFYQPRKKEYSRIVFILTDNKSGNARKNVLINTKRNDIVHFFNEYGKDSYLYQIFLTQTNNYVPNEHLISHLKIIFKQECTGKISLKPDQLNIEMYFERMLFPFNAQVWSLVLKQMFPKLNSFNYYHYQQNYFFMQLSTLYMIKFAKNAELLYLDLKDFDSFLSKFNFIRFFYQTSTNNQYLARKYSERLIKLLEWRTQQSEEYLLLLIRNNNWQRFLLMVQDFCISYEILEKKNLLLI